MFEKIFVFGIHHSREILFVSIKSGESVKMSHISIAVDWYGPYCTETAKTAAKEDFSDGLYMLIGKVKHQKRSSELQYVGIAKDLYNRVNEKTHHKIKYVSQQCNIWLGEVVTIGIPGRKQKATDMQQDLAEWCHAYFLQLPLNDKKKINPPFRPCTVLNRWWSKNDFEKPLRKKPHGMWPDIIDFWGRDYGGKVIWGGRKVENWHPEDFT